MIGQELVIKLRNKKAWISSTKYLKFEQIGLHEYYNFKPKAFIKVVILKYYDLEKRLATRILYFGTNEIDFTDFQRENADIFEKINQLSLGNINTPELLKLIDNSQVKKQKETQLTDEQITFIDHPKILHEPKIQEIEERINISLTKTTFINGGIYIKTKLKTVYHEVEFTIENIDIIEEFDSIKKYFANVLGKNKVALFIKIRLVDGIVENIEANSTDLEKIYGSFIESVRQKFIKDKIRQLQKDNDDVIHTRDDLIDLLEEDSKLKEKLFKSDEDLVQDFLRISKSKHYRQLGYLADKHDHNIMKIRYILKPFSVLFLYSGNEKYHIIWETLDTKEATYFWSIQKEAILLKKRFKEIENIINEIRIKGRYEYLKSEDFDFNRVYHDYSDIKKGFLNWKNELESYLA